jgi:hypothetical protein
MLLILLDKQAYKVCTSCVHLITQMKIMRRLWFFLSNIYFVQGLLSHFVYGLSNLLISFADWVGGYKRPVLCEKNAYLSR